MSDKNREAVQEAIHGMVTLLDAKDREIEKLREAAALSVVRQRTEQGGARR